MEKFKRERKDSQSLRKKLVELKRGYKSFEQENRLFYKVSSILLAKSKDYNDLKNVFNDVLEHGLSGGLIGELIYTTDCQKFYDKYYTEIEDIIAELEAGTGEKVESWNKSGIDRKNFLAWLGFEEAVRIIAGELGIEQ